MDTNVNMIDCESFLNLELPAFSIGCLHPTIKHHEKSKRPKVALFREEEKLLDEIVVVLDDVVIWSKGNYNNSLHLPADYKSMSFPGGLDFVLWCTFDRSNESAMPIEKYMNTLVLIKDTYLTAVSYQGDLFQSRLSVEVKSVWATKHNGLIVESKDLVSTSVTLPCLYNLEHPCDELAPIICCTKSNFDGRKVICEFTCAMNNTVVASLPEKHILITHSSKKGHTFWIVRKAYSDEKEEFYRQRELKMNELNSTTAARRKPLFESKGGTAASFHDKRQVFSPINRSVFLSQSMHKYRHSPLVERNLSITNNTAPRVSLLYSQPPVHHSSPLVSSSLDVNSTCSTSVLPTFEMPLTPNLCLEFITSEDFASQKHASKFASSKAFCSNDFLGQQYICLQVPQSDSLVFYQVSNRSSSKDNASLSNYASSLSITKAGVISCVDSVALEKLPYLAVFERDLSITLYSGPQKLCKMRYNNGAPVELGGLRSLFNFQGSLGRSIVANTVDIENVALITLPHLVNNPCVAMFIDSFKRYFSACDFMKFAATWFTCRNSLGNNSDSHCEIDIFLNFLECELGFVYSQADDDSMVTDDANSNCSKKVRMRDEGDFSDWQEMLSYNFVFETLKICQSEDLIFDSQANSYQTVDVTELHNPSGFDVSLNEKSSLNKYFSLVIEITHLIYEECKLDVTKSAECKRLAIFLATVAHNFGLESWKLQYFCDYPVEVFPIRLHPRDISNNQSETDRNEIDKDERLDNKHNLFSRLMKDFPVLKRYNEEGAPNFVAWMKSLAVQSRGAKNKHNASSNENRNETATVTQTNDDNRMVRNHTKMETNASNFTNKEASNNVVLDAQFEYTCIAQLPFPCIRGVTKRIIKSAIFYCANLFGCPIDKQHTNNIWSRSVKQLIPKVLKDLRDEATCSDNLINELNSVDVMSAKVTFSAAAESGEEKEAATNVNVALEENERTTNGHNEKMLFLMSNLKIDSCFIETLPFGVALPFYEVVYNGHSNPSLNWPHDVIKLIKRLDLIEQMTYFSSIDDPRDVEVASKSTRTKFGTSKFYKSFEAASNGQVATLLPGGLYQAAKKCAVNQNSDGFEMDNEVLNCLFAHDYSVKSVKRMLNSSQPVKLKANPQQPAEMQIKLSHYSKRTMSLPIGRGMFTLSSVSPTITGTEPIPEMNFSCRVLPKNVTVQITTATLSYAARSWPFYHNGVAAGLRIDQNQPDISSSWVLYNRPKSTGSGEAASLHAGFLLGLALNGHLDNMPAYEYHSYLCRYHELTSVSLLLGLCASKQGSKDKVLSRILTLHISALLPPNGTELDVGFNVQTAALLAAGFLYMGTAEKHIAEVLLNQINRPPGPEMDNCVNRESHSLAAGLALGMVLIGKGGGNCFGELTADVSFTSQLRSYIKGGANPHLPIQSHCYQIQEGENINLSLTSPGASLATGLIFFDTCSYPVSDWFNPPETASTIDCLLPEHLMLHVVAKCLIRWREVLATFEWVRSNLPTFLKHVLDYYESPRIALAGFNISCAQAYCNIVAGSCFSIGLRFAGSHNKQAFELSLKFVEMFLILLEGATATETCLAATEGTTVRIGVRTIFTCLQTCLIAVCMIVAGSGNGQVLGIIRYLHCLIGPNCGDYGQHMAVHMCLGLLFLGGCRYSLRNDPPAIAALLASFYPIFPMSSEDNRYHLQAFRHLYVKAAEPRLLLTRNVNTFHIERVCVEVVLKPTVHYGKYSMSLITPCLIPQIDLISHIAVVNQSQPPLGRQFLPIKIDLNKNRWFRTFFGSKILPTYLLVQSCSDLTSKTDQNTNTITCNSKSINSAFSVGNKLPPTHKLCDRVTSCLCCYCYCSKCDCKWNEERGLSLKYTQLNFVNSFVQAYKLTLESVILCIATVTLPSHFTAANCSTTSPLSTLTTLPLNEHHSSNNYLSIEQKQKFPSTGKQHPRNISGHIFPDVCLNSNLQQLHLVQKHLLMHSKRTVNVSERASKSILTLTGDCVLSNSNWFQCLFDKIYSKLLSQENDYVSPLDFSDRIEGADCGDCSSLKKHNTCFNFSGQFYSKIFIQIMSKRTSNIENKRLVFNSRATVDSKRSNGTQLNRCLQLNQSNALNVCSNSAASSKAAVSSPSYDPVANEHQCLDNRTSVSSHVQSVDQARNEMVWSQYSLQNELNRFTQLIALAGNGAGSCGCGCLSNCSQLQSNRPFHSAALWSKRESKFENDANDVYDGSFGVVLPGDLLFGKLLSKGLSTSSANISSPGKQGDCKNQRNTSTTAAAVELAAHEDSNYQQQQFALLLHKLRALYVT